MLGPTLGLELDSHKSSASSQAAPGRTAEDLRHGLPGQLLEFLMPLIGSMQLGNQRFVPRNRSP